MAVQSSTSQQPLEDHLRMGQNVNTETLSMSAPYKNTHTTGCGCNIL